MPAVFEQLPGIDVPVGHIAESLASMWRTSASEGRDAPATDEVRAMQMNFVLHLGFATTPDDALQQFETIKRFAHRYPCRVVVLCPLRNDDGAVDFRAKVYGECFIGKSKGDTRCVEFVMLSYPMRSRAHLEDQVSVCLSTDLPLYYWAHRFSDSARLADYQYLLNHAKRVIFDTAITPSDAKTYPWPNQDTIRDLVWARLLPVRQSIGQFLSGFEPARLVDGLKRVKVYHRPQFEPEGRVLMDWLLQRLGDCGAVEAVKTHVVPSEARGTDDFAVAFDYDGGSYFKWRADIAHNHGEFAADMGSGRVELTTSMHLLSPEWALSEAVFF